MEINFLFFISVVPAIILYGIAKSGLGGSISLISVPLMTIVMPLQQALAIILPILIFSDLIAVYRFRREFNFSILKVIVPFAALGIVIGSLSFNHFSENEAWSTTNSHPMTTVSLLQKTPYHEWKKSFETFASAPTRILTMTKVATSNWTSPTKTS